MLKKHEISVIFSINMFRTKLVTLNQNVQKKLLNECWLEQKFAFT